MEIRGQTFDLSGFQKAGYRDIILPIYRPVFEDGQDTDLEDWELVLGVEINGEAKAYPIGPLTDREMVIDELGGIPILVSW